MAAPCGSSAMCVSPLCDAAAAGARTDPTRALAGMPLTRAPAATSPSTRDAAPTSTSSPMTIGPTAMAWAANTTSSPSWGEPWMPWPEFEPNVLVP